jgi:hypothetical protein
MFSGKGACFSFRGHLFNRHVLCSNPEETVDISSVVRVDIFLELQVPKKSLPLLPLQVRSDAQFGSAFKKSLVAVLRRVRYPESPLENFREFRAVVDIESRIDESVNIRLRVPPQNRPIALISRDSIRQSCGF